jgi:hypothetical protein
MDHVDDSTRGDSLVLSSVNMGALLGLGLNSNGSPSSKGKMQNLLNPDEVQYLGSNVDLRKT